MPDYRFAELSESLKNGFLSDEVVLAVARAQRGSPVSEVDRAVLRRAAAVLDAAIQGHDWLDNPTLTTSTKHAATDFGRAVRAPPSAHIAGFRPNNAGIARGSRSSGGGQPD